MNDEFGTYLTVLILACFGSLVDFVNKLNKSTQRPPMKVILFDLFAKLLSSAFAGLLMFWSLQSMSDNHIVVLNGWSAMSISISGYLGIQALNLFVSAWKALVTKSIEK